MFGGFNILFKDSAFLLVGFNKHTWVADEMRVSSGQYDSHSFRVHKSHKPKHPFLLVWNPYILHRSKIATNKKQSLIRRYQTKLWWMQSHNSFWCWFFVFERLPEVVGDIFISEGAISWKSQVNLFRCRVRFISHPHNKLLPFMSPWTTKPVPLIPKPSWSAPPKESLTFTPQHRCIVWIRLANN